MRNFVITVNGAQYQVAVEEVAPGAAPVVAAPAPAPRRTSTCRPVIGSNPANMNGTDARHENALKKRMMRDGESACRLKARTHAYAPPAQTPLRSPIESGNADESANPGFAISTTPRNASASVRSCRLFARSPRKSHAKRTVKNGAVLLSVSPSAIEIFPSA